MRSYAGALIPSVTGALMRRGVRTRTQREGEVRTQGEDSCARAKERGLQENNPAWTLAPDFQPLEPGK